MNEYEGVMERVRRGDILLTRKCYDPVTGAHSNDARELPGLFPDFDKAYKDAIKRLPS